MLEVSNCEKKILVYLSANRLMQAVFLNEVKHFWFEKLEIKKGKGNFRRLSTEGGLNTIWEDNFTNTFLVHTYISI